MIIPVRLHSIPCSLQCTDLDGIQLVIVGYHIIGNVQAFILFSVFLHGLLEFFHKLIGIGLNVRIDFCHVILQLLTAVLILGTHLRYVYVCLIMFLIHLEIPESHSFHDNTQHRDLLHGHADRCAAVGQNSDAHRCCSGCHTGTLPK